MVTRSRCETGLPSTSSRRESRARVSRRKKTADVGGGRRPSPPRARAVRSARPVKPCAHRPDRDLERRCDLLVAEAGERVEEQRVLSRAHRRKSACPPRIERRAVSSGRVVLVRRPAVDSRANESAQPPALDPPAAPKQVRGDPVQPRQGAGPRPAAGTPLEGECERLDCQLVGQITTGPSMEIPMDRVEVPVEDRLERPRLGQRALSSPCRREPPPSPRLWPKPEIWFHSPRGARGGLD